MRPTRAEICITAFKKNLATAKKYAGNAGVMAVLKADAYGHGLERLAQEAYSSGFIEKIALTSVEEAVRVRLSGVDCPIVLLEGIFESSELLWCVQNNIELVLHSAYQLDALFQNDWRKRFPLRASLKLWLKLNTGMNRLGFSLDEAAVWLEKLIDSDEFDFSGLVSHFACADEIGSDSVLGQIKVFEQFSQHWPSLKKSFSNSAALLSLPEVTHDLVRPGLMLYGASPLQDKTAQELMLEPVMRLVSEVIALQDLKKGDCVGYGGSWKADCDKVIAVVAIGYADGYPRHASNAASVVIDGIKCPVVGRVSMDMITVDVTEIGSVRVGSTVELWGINMPVDEVSQACDTIAYELLTGVTSRVPRVYIES